MREIGKTTLLCALAALGMAATLATSACAHDRPSSSDAAARGKALFQEKGCYACHGLSGQGGTGPMTGPRIARPDLPEEAFRYIVRNGMSVMPPYSAKVLSDAQLADIAAYLRTSFKPGDIGAISILRRR